MGEDRKVYMVLVGMPKGKRPIGRLRHRWEDRIRMDLRETDLVGGGKVDPVGSGSGPVEGSCKYSHEPVGSGTMVLVS
jgi:hypothetical protein